jgi:hypothetical protein
MSELVTKKAQIITILKKNEFNCFPIPYGQKNADNRYKGSRTTLNQKIREDENFGYISTKKNCTADFDHEKYNEILDRVAEKFMVIKTAHNRRHLPVRNLGTNATKIELFDYSIQDKKIIEIQGNDHYCVFGTLLENGETLEYENIGTDVIYNAEGLDFESFVDYICKKFNVQEKKKTDNAYYEMRERFRNGKIPTPQTSNSYFFQSAIVCNTDGNTIDEATERIRKVYDKWKVSATFSNRTWSNVLTAINKVYDGNLKVALGRKKGSDSGIDRTQIALDIAATRNLFSDEYDEREIINENVNGFLESINAKLKKQLQQQYPKMSKSDYTEIASKVWGFAKSMPELNKDLIVFKNGIYSLKEGKFVESDDIAYSGFKDYEYIENPNPKKFIEIMYGNIPDEEHERLNAFLSSILKPYYNSKMTVIHGLSGVGKSTGLSIIAKILGQYSMVTDLKQVLEDKPTQSNLKGKLFLVIRELPPFWNKLDMLKIMLGETTFSGRKNYGDHDQWDNTITVSSSTNNPPPIPEEEKQNMHTRRLSLVHNTREEPYPEDPTLEDDIIKKEGSDILSYLVNLMKDNYKYEDRQTNQEEWEKLASPENDIIERCFEYEDGMPDISLYHLVKIFKDNFKINISRTRLTEGFLNAGFNVYASKVKDCRCLFGKVTSY